MTWVASTGYVGVYLSDYRWVYQHRLMAEKALGRPLDPGNQVHHFVGKDNSQGLVICESNSYHRLLHARQRIVDAGGDPNLQKICGQCRSLKPKSEFPITRRNYDGLRCYCRPCGASKCAKRYRAKKVTQGE